MVNQIYLSDATVMQGLCGIRRLGVRGDLDLFHFVVNRSNFVLKSFFVGCYSALYDVFDFNIPGLSCRTHKVLLMI